jgi:FKBP-type peptidyl-prolyl cis-trans isomerase
MNPAGKEELSMRVLSAFALAVAVVLAAGTLLPAAPEPKDSGKKDEWKKGERPNLNAKSWKKQKSGLEIWDVKEGKGDVVPAGGTVKVHYIGWLTDKDATVFDSSVKRNQPIEFSLNRVIKGWQEGIPGMKPGGVRLLKIPADLAYGDRAVGDLIPAGSTLVFEVELLEVK